MLELKAHSSFIMGILGLDEYMAVRFSRSSLHAARELRTTISRPRMFRYIASEPVLLESVN